MNHAVAHDSTSKVSKCGRHANGGQRENGDRGGKHSRPKRESTIVRDPGIGGALVSGIGPCVRD